MYYKANREKWILSEDQRRKKNERRRAQYAESSAVREKAKRASKDYRKRHPHKRRAREIDVRYGLSIEAYNDMLARQHGSCAICMVEFDKTPHVDHCHTRGVVRGLLCFNCNRAIGHLQDSVEITKRALQYLQTTGEELKSEANC